MKINTKIIFLVGLSLLGLSIILTLFFGWQLWHNGKISIAQLEKLNTESINNIKFDPEKNRAQLVDQKKEYLKSQIQTAISVLRRAYDEAHNPEKLKEIYREPLQNAVNTAFGILAAIEKDPVLTRAEKQQKAIQLIKNLRYGPENKDYFWINDTYPKMIMHPYKPQLDNKDVSEVKDPNGKRLFIEFVNVCKENGQGFVEYYWPKYGADKPQPKLSFVKLFKPWNWIIGSGVYIEVAEDKLKSDARELVKSLRYGPENKDYFWINDMHAKMIMHPYKPELDGKDLSEMEDSKGKKLFTEFVNICKQNGQGFVKYFWPKYGADKPQPKLSYVKLFDKWNWVIGTGIYIDDVDQIVDANHNEVQEKINTTSAQMKTQIAATKATIETNIKKSMILGALTVLLLLTFIIALTLVFTKYAITRPLTLVISSLDQGADQVHLASGQMSENSDSLASGSSEQAASIEETTASLAEIGSMTKTNAQNANLANQLMSDTGKIITKANESMINLTHSMEEISQASHKTSLIIKTIDEIAFQTNLLALNAAVEAARAGQAGAGFAVVADEVRNLAIRAAEAAKSTSELIESTIKTVETGSSIVESTHQAFVEVSEGSQKVGALISEIANATNDQKNGIEQVNKSVVQMDLITQTNAQSAQESAAASHEMKLFAQKMKTCVQELIRFAGKTTNGRNTSKLEASSLTVDHYSPDQRLLKDNHSRQPLGIMHIKS